MISQDETEAMAIRAELVRRLANRSFLTAAIAQATRDAAIKHKRAGNPIAEWRDGKVVTVQPEDIVVPGPDAA